MGKQLDFTVEEKTKLLKAHFPSFDMSDKRECLHCGKVIAVKNFRVFKEDNHLFITCPEDGCDGSPLDWMPLSDDKSN